MKKKDKDKKQIINSDQFKSIASLSELKKNYHRELSEIFSTASIARNIVNNMKVDTSAFTNIAKIQTGAMTEFTEKTSTLNTQKNLTEYYININRQLFELNKVNLSGITNLVESVTSKIEIINASWSKMFSINEQVNNVLSQSIFNEIESLSDFKIDESLKNITNNSNKVFISLHSNLEEFPEGIREKVIREIGVDEAIIHDSLKKLKQIIEQLAIDGFWISRRKDKLKSRPETIAQGLSATNLQSMLDKRFTINPQTRVGIGTVDILINYVNTRGEIGKYLIEIKIISRKENLEDGIDQLFEYQKISEITNATRLLFNATKFGLEAGIRSKDSYTQRDVIVNINPIAPSKL